MCRLALIASLLGVAAPGARALADEAVRLDVAVGQTVERDVGFAIGVLCDDLAILRIELRPSTPESNRLSVTGIKEGSTMCRVGTAPERPSFVFEIHVVAARPRR
jgi:hypothetical protein